MSKQQIDFNHRSTIQDLQVDYLASLRDSAIFNLYGIRVDVKIPIVENNVDEYQNFKDSDFHVEKIVVVPLFKDYRMVLSKYGMTAEDSIMYPLDILFPSGMHLPRNSRILLSEYDANENKIAREWRVESTETKQLSNSKSYTKVAHCVPARTNIVVSGDVLITRSLLEIEDIDEDAIIIRKLQSSIVNVICTSKVTVTHIVDAPDPELTAFVTCTGNVRVLDPSIYNN